MQVLHAWPQAEVGDCSARKILEIVAELDSQAVTAKQNAPAKTHEMGVRLKLSM